jgi:hypothetical protein
MISVTHFETLYSGKNCLVRALLGTLKSAIFTFTYYKEKAPLLYRQLSEHLQRFAQYVTLPKTNSHPRSVTVFTLLQTHP